jgi:Probable cobalt transporter subunit (CbtA)
MVGNLLLRGMLVGVFAGLLAFGFAKIFGEPQFDRAIAFEEQMNQAKGEAPEPELVSRETQAGLLQGTSEPSAFGTHARVIPLANPLKGTLDRSVPSRSVRSTAASVLRPGR